MTARPDALRELEREIGVMVRRVRRVIDERARSVHPDLQSSSYLMLGYLLDNGPLRASAMSTVFDIDKGAISRQVQHLIDLGLVERTPDPDDGRATLLSITDEATRRMQDVSAHRRKWLEEQLGDWSDAQLDGFVRELGRYNSALSQADPG